MVGSGSLSRDKIREPTGLKKWSFFFFLIFLIFFDVFLIFDVFDVFDVFDPILMFFDVFGCFLVSQ